MTTRWGAFGVAGFLALPVGAVEPANPPVPGGGCEVLAAESDLTTAASAMIKDFLPGHDGFDWLKSVRRCELGAFVIYAPSGSRSHHLVVEKDGKLIVSIEPEQVLLLPEGKGLRFAVADSNLDGTFDHVHAYIAGTPAGANFGAADLDQDGVTDLVSFMDERGRARKLALIDGQWVENVEKEGARWWLVRGELVKTREEAAARLRGGRRE